METILINENDAIVRQNVEKMGLYPDFDKFNNGKEFSELYDKGVKFVQVEVYDPYWASCSEEVRKRKGRPHSLRFLIDFEDKEALDIAVDAFNKAQEEVRRELLNRLENDPDMRWSEYDTRTYLTFSNISIKVNTYVRDKDAEYQKEIERQEEHERRMEEDEKYRAEVQWYEEKERPCGGAFGSVAEMERHLGMR